MGNEDSCNSTPDNATGSDSDHGEVELDDGYSGSSTSSSDCRGSFDKFGEDGDDNSDHSDDISHPSDAELVITRALP